MFTCNNGCGDWGSGVWSCLLNLIILIVVLEFLGNVIGGNGLGCGNMSCCGNGSGNNDACCNY